MTRPIPILLYHGVDPDPPAALGSFVIRPDRFAEHMASVESVSHLTFIINGALICYLLIKEPHGFAKLWSVTKEKLRLWPFPH